MDLLLNTGDATTAVQIRARRRLHVDVADVDVLAYGGAGALQVPNERIVLLACRALEVLNRDIGNGELGGELVAKRNVLLAIALCDLNGVIDISHRHTVVRDVGHLAAAAAALQIARQRRRRTRPHLDARPVRRIGHGHISDVDVLHNIDLAGVLAQRPNRDAVRPVAHEVLHHDIRAVRLERHAIIPIIDVGVLNHNVAAPIRVPAVRVLSRVLADAAALDVDVGEDDVG